MRVFAFFSEMLQWISFMFCIAVEANTVQRLATVLLSGSTSRLLVSNDFFWHHFYSSWDIAITPLVTKLRPFFLQKFHKVVNFQKAPWTLFHCGLVIWCKFQLIGTTIEGAVTFGVKYLKMLILFLFFIRDSIPKLFVHFLLRRPTF